MWTTGKNEKSFAFSNEKRIHADGPKRFKNAMCGHTFLKRKKLEFTKENGYMWMKPYTIKQMQMNSTPTVTENSEENYIES